MPLKLKNIGSTRKIRDNTRFILNRVLQKAAKIIRVERRGRDAMSKSKQCYDLMLRSRPESFLTEFLLIGRR